MPSVPTTKPPEGFMMWVNPYRRYGDPSPSMYDVVEVWREGALEPWTLRPADMHPMQNVYGLYWRPVKAFGETVN